MYVRIYTADVDCLEDGELFGKVCAFVPPERRDKAEKLRLAKDKRLSLGAGALAKIALMEACGAEREIEYGENGKPYVKGEKELFIGISHSGSVAMCAVSDVDVGCDVEKICDADLKIAKRFFSPEENEYIDAAEDPCGAFYGLWTKKESFLKATGLGFTVSAKDFSTVCGVVKTELFPGAWSAFNIDICAGYAAAYCVSGETKPDVSTETILLDSYFADQKR